MMYFFREVIPGLLEGPIEHVMKALPRKKNVQIHIPPRQVQGFVGLLNPIAGPPPTVPRGPESNGFLRTVKWVIPKEEQILYLLT